MLVQRQDQPFLLPGDKEVDMKLSDPEGVCDIPRCLCSHSCLCPALTHPPHESFSLTGQQ